MLNRRAYQGARSQPRALSDRRTAYGVRPVLVPRSRAVAEAGERTTDRVPATTTGWLPMLPIRVTGPVTVTVSTRTPPVLSPIETGPRTRPSSIEHLSGGADHDTGRRPPYREGAAAPTRSR